MQEKVRTVVKTTDESFSMHDFRMVKGPTNTNLIFDVSVPSCCQKTDNEIMNNLKEKIKEPPGGQVFSGDSDRSMSIIDGKGATTS